MNPWVYLCLIVGGNVLAAIFGMFALDRATEEITPLVPVPILVAAIANLVMIGRLWGSLPFGEGRMSAGKAVGLMFVPLFNLYWIFNVFLGFAADFNRVVDGRRLDVPRVNPAAAIAYALASVVQIPVVSWVVQGWAIVHLARRAGAMRRWAEESPYGAAGSTAHSVAR